MNYTGPTRYIYTNKDRKKEKKEEKKRKEKEEEEEERAAVEILIYMQHQTKFKSIQIKSIKRTTFNTLISNRGKFINTQFIRLLIMHVYIYVWHKSK